MNNFEVYAQKVKAAGLTLTPEGKQRLLDALAWIEKHEKRFDMWNWIEPNGADCGTTLCYAGTIAFQALGWHINTLVRTDGGKAHYRFHSEIDGYVEDFVDRLLLGEGAGDLDIRVQNPLWHLSQWSIDAFKTYQLGDRVDGLRLAMNEFIAAFEAA